MPDPAPEWTFGAWEVFPYPPALHRLIIKQAAFVRNLQVESISSRCYVISDDTREVAFWDDIPDTTSLVARRVSISKPLTKRLLERAGLRVAPGRVFPRDHVRPALRFAQSIGFPVVVKPTLLRGGCGVTANVGAEAAFRLAWTSAQSASRAGRIMVEKHVHGRDFRLYVIGDRLVAATQRIPACVEGDGQSSILELVARKTEVRRSNPYVGGKAMKLTPVMIANLRGMDLAPDAVLDRGRRVELHSVANIGAGGESLDVTDQVHPDFQDISVRARRALPGAVNLGVDLLVEDIAAPAAGQEWAICEVNTAADISLHHFPIFGTPRDAAGALIEHFFPGSRKHAPSQQQTLHLIISGNVTGTGFRAWIWRRANYRGLAGWVRNRRQDSVEAVFSGAPLAVDSMVRLCRIGPSKAVVGNVAIKPGTELVAGEFQIRS